MHSQFFQHTSIDTNCVQMFSLVQDPPEPPTFWEKNWHGKKVGRTREETSTCIKGVPGNFVASQPVPAGSIKALCPPNPKVVRLDAPHNYLFCDPCYTPRYPPIVVKSSSANHSNTTNNETAKCQKAVTNLYDLPHWHKQTESFQAAELDLPLEDPFLDGWRGSIASLANPDFAEEVLNYWQTEANELLSRNVTAADFTLDLRLCGYLDPETNKYIKCTLFTSLREPCSRKYILQQPYFYPDETPD